MDNRQITTEKLLAIRNLSDSPEVKEKLIQKGYGSSVLIYNRPKTEFIDDVRDIVTEEEADTIYEKANHNYVLLTHMVAANRTAQASRTYRAMQARWSDRGADRKFEDIPNYQEVFGKLDYCDCPNCKSIFGPAAYFVDLMRIIQKHILLEKGDRAVPLAVRRRDLFTRGLTCENTNNEKPYLEIVNEILEGYLAPDMGRKEFYKELSQKTFPLPLPYNLPAEKIRVWLEKSDLQFADIMESWKADPRLAATERMRLNKEQFSMLEKPVEQSRLAACFGMDTIDLEEIKSVSKFTSLMQLTEQELRQILEQDIKKQEQSQMPSLFINQGMKAKDQYLYLEDGVIVNLTEDALERLYRFIRLQQVYKISAGELDWLLKTAGTDEKGNIPLVKVVKLMEFARKTGMGVYEITALCGPVKDYGDNPFKEIFGRDRQELEPLTAAAFARVLSNVLSIDSDAVQLLIAYLGEGGTADAVYRHGKLAACLSMDIREYLIYLKLAFSHRVSVFDADMLDSLFKDRINDRFSVYEADYIVNGVKSPYAACEFNLENFGHQVALLRLNPPDGWEDDRELCESYVYTGLAEYFGQTPEELSMLMDCVLDKTEKEKWPQRVLQEEIGSLSPEAEQLFHYFVMVKAGLPVKLLCAANSNRESFGIVEKGRFTWRNLLDISGFYVYFQLFQDHEDKLLQFAEEYSRDSRKVDTLAELTGWEKQKILDVMGCLYHGEKEKNVKILIDDLVCAFHILTRLSLDPEGIRQMLLVPESAYEEAEDIADTLIGPDLDCELAAALEKSRREALLPVVRLKLSETYEDITDDNKLYKYFLIDVKMDDKTRISYIKEGINALQLYLQRCRLHLEKGIREVTIPESWWSWIMDYRLWEANRKIFVYPENYLLPSIRQSKTRLFQNMEDALQQSNITEGYIEEQYIKYLDDYFQLTQLKITGAYATEIDNMNVLYVFARTKEQPYTYYYCERVSTLAWSEWKKIDTNIDSPVITPVYVFNRLHVFWSVVNESAKVKVESNKESSDISLAAANQKAYELQIKYTYLNLQGKWIPPQVLTKDEIIYARDDKTDSEETRKKVSKLNIDIKDRSFDKLTLLRLTNKNFEGFLDKSKNYECLAVITGSFSQNLGSREELLEEGETLDKEEDAFSKRLNRMIENSNFEIANDEDGYGSTGYFKVFNEDLEEEHLIHPREFIVIDGYIPTKYSLMYTPLHDEIHRAVGVYCSQSILRDSFLPTKGILPTENSSEKLRLTGESFVIYDKEGNVVIDKTLSGEIFTKLRNEELIDDSGHVNEKMLANTDLQNFLKDLLLDEPGISRKNNRILEIQSILLKNIGAVYLFKNADKADIIPVANQPGQFIYDCGDEAFLVYPVYEKEDKYYPADIEKTDAGITIGSPVTANTFVKLGFEWQKSRQILSGLKAKGLINKDGIADMELCTREKLEAALDQLIPETGVKKEEKIDRIYIKLQNFPVISKNEFAKVTGITGESVCSVLLKEKVFYPWENSDAAVYYRIDLTRLKQNNHILFTNRDNGMLSDGAVKEIYDKITKAVSSVNFNYRINPDLPREFTKAPFSDRMFGVQRLTNPTIKKLKRKLETGGIKGFLDRKTQSAPETPIMPFSRLGPTRNVVPPRAADGAQVDFDGLYGEYNWELFYHIPVAIAQCMKGNLFHEEGMKWFHYIFNPTNPKDSTLQRYYWNFIPFTMLEDETMKQMLENPSAIQAYNDAPFNPHAIARLRVGAYAKYTIMEYVSNIIAWGDKNFIQNTWESLTSATMMYVWASDLLGPRPKKTGEFQQKKELNFQNIDDYYKDDPMGIPQFILDLEQQMQLQIQDCDYQVTNEEIPFNDVRAYFGVPENEQILYLWDLVEDRLFKLRNSLDINGAPRITALFEAPVDVNALTKAAAASSGTLPKSLTRKTALYPYRFSYMIEQAKSVASQLIQLGNSILQALEKNDAETMLAMTNSQEQIILNMTTSIRENQILEITDSIQALETAKNSAQSRFDFYDRNAKEYMSSKEIASFAVSSAAAVLQAAGGTARFAAGMAHLLPQVGSPFAMKYGGKELGDSLNGVAAGYEALAGIAAHAASQTLTIAQYDRRKAEWELQREQAKYEMVNLDKQIEAATVRRKSAKKELQLHRKNMKFKDEVLSFLKTKFTGVQLYQWLLGKLSSTMWQTYQLALELSLSAQEAYCYERDETADFIRYDYWDGGKKGLMSGECLMLALEQMQQNYMKKNKRRLEIEKNISMAVVFREALEELKANGSCSFYLSEKLFAADYPSCYCRKITGITLSVPAVLPPYETVKGILKQQSSDVLLKPDKTGIDYLFGLTKNRPDSSIVQEAGRYGEKIAVSRGIDDSGMFTMQFQDERYLPFEGTGVASGFHLEMPRQSNRFDFGTITDIIINIKYTALEDEGRGAGSFYDYVGSRLA